MTAPGPNDIDQFLAWVRADVRGEASLDQQRALQADDETCRRWISTLRLLISEVESDTAIRDAQVAPLKDSQYAVDRQRYADHLAWKRKSGKFAAACRNRLLFAEDVLRRVSGLSEMADRLLAGAANLVTDGDWLQGYRQYQIRKFGQLPQLPAMTTELSTKKNPSGTEE